MDEEDQLRFGFDLLDPTKIVPEDLVPFTPLGKLTLNRNPRNYFAETEQIMVGKHLGRRRHTLTSYSSKSATSFAALTSQTTRYSKDEYSLTWTPSLTAMAVQTLSSFRSTDLAFLCTRTLVMELVSCPIPMLLDCMLLTCLSSNVHPPQCRPLLAEHT
jgi:hypothetical protein